jgi:FKBP-type peptidyl-prolyl cis-trans isomerase SlyD
VTTTPLTLQAGRVGLFHYTLRNGAGDVLDASSDHPMAYLHGHNNIIPGLESALTGQGAGAALDVVIAPADAYGDKDAEAFQSVHRSEFPAGMELQVGMPVHAEGSGGQRMTLWISRIEGARVEVTSNHPLAGETLHFNVQVVEVREARPEELAHGHVHGVGGHHH